MLTPDAAPDAAFMKELKEDCYNNKMISAKRVKILITAYEAPRKSESGSGGDGGVVDPSAPAVGTVNEGAAVDASPGTEAGTSTPVADEPVATDDEPASTKAAAPTAPGRSKKRGKERE